MEDLTTLSQLDSQTSDVTPTEVAFPIFHSLIVKVSLTSKLDKCFRNIQTLLHQHGHQMPSVLLI